MGEVCTIRSIAGEAQVIIKPPVEYLQSFWQKGEFFEQEMLEHIYENYRGGTFVDIGSAIGNHTLFFAKFCEPDLVVSIEPVQAQVKHQAAILALNGVAGKVKLLNLALSDKPGSGHMEHFAGSWGQFRLVEGKGPISVDTLDNLIDRLQLSDLTLVKIDVEQHELHLLRSARKMLTEQSPALFIEVVARPLAPFKRFLAPYGYRRVGEKFKAANAYEFRKY